MNTACVLRLATGLIAACLALAGCGKAGPRPGALAGGEVPTVPRAVKIGSGPRFQPPPGAVAIAGQRCLKSKVGHYAAHLELFAAGRIVIVPAGIGITGPRERRGPYVTGGRCSYGVRTQEPTGVIEVANGQKADLGDLFAVWGRALGNDRMLSFTGPVRAWVDGKKVSGDPRGIELRRHAEIVLVVGPPVPVHATYAFAPGV